MAQTLYAVNQYPIQILLSWVQAGEIAIPEIQRPFVWETKQVRELIDSLYKGYPVGYLIAWKNHDVRLKTGESSAGKKILIDGQQRITALMASILGKKVINSHYKKVSIKISFHPMEEKFETFTPAIEKDDAWFNDISVLIDTQTNLFNLVNDYIAKNPECDQSTIFDRVQKLRNIVNNQIGLIELDNNLDIEEVTEIFIRINSKGKVLSQADFVMSKIAANETYRGHELRKLIDYFCHLSILPEDYEQISSMDEDFQKVEEVKKLSWLKDEKEDLYDPDYTDVLRVAFISQFGRGRLRDLVALLSGRNFETRSYEEEIAEQSFEILWDGVKKVVNETNFKRFMMILRSAGLCHKTLVGSTNVVNYAYIVYLLLREEKVAPELIEKYVRKAYVFNTLMERFAGNPEGTFDFDIKRIKEQGFIKYFQSQEETQLSDTFWNAALPMKFNTPVSSSPFYRLYLAAQCSLNDRGFLSKAISIQDMVLHRGDVHHIYPKNYLKKQGFKQNKYNQIANYALTQQEVNIKISDNEPQVYINEVINQCDTKELVYGGIDNFEELKQNFKMNCIPEYMLTGDIPEFEVFLADRQKLMAKKLKEYYDKL
jgi:hypothetical protein